MTPGIPTIIKVGLATRYNVLKSFRLHAGVDDRDHSKRFFLVAGVFLRYLMVKLKNF